MYSVTQIMVHIRISHQNRWAFVLLAVCLLGGLGVAQAQTTFNVTPLGISDYLIDGVADPTLTLERGQTYTFVINATFHPFYIKTISSAGTINVYNDGVTGNGTQVGNVVFVVPLTAPDTLYYDCSVHAPMTGQLNIVDPPPPPPQEVRIIDFTLTTNIVIISTGTNTWNVVPEFRTSLQTGAWSPLPITTNIYVNGTNTTVMNVPTGNLIFLRVKQTVP